MLAVLMLVRDVGSGSGPHPTLSAACSSASSEVHSISDAMPDATQSAINSACATKTGVSLLRHGYSSAGSACGTAPKPRAAARIENKTRRRIFR